LEKGTTNDSLGGIMPVSGSGASGMRFGPSAGGGDWVSGASGSPFAVDVSRAAAGWTSKTASQNAENPKRGKIRSPEKTEDTPQFPAPQGLDRRFVAEWLFRVMRNLPKQGGRFFVPLDQGSRKDSQPAISRRGRQDDTEYGMGSWLAWCHISKAACRSPCLQNWNFLSIVVSRTTTAPEQAQSPETNQQGGRGLGDEHHIVDDNIIATNIIWIEGRPQETVSSESLGCGIGEGSGGGRNK